MYIQRKVQQAIEAKLFSHNVIVVYGPRQAGKTTLVKKILEPFSDDGIYLNCEDPEIFALLKSFDIGSIYEHIKNKKVVVFDEAQRIPNIGMLLKLLFDTYPDIQYIATGSSSFDLSQQLGEPLVGRSWEFIVYPFGITEVSQDALSYKKLLGTLMIYGSYPEVHHLSVFDKELKLKTIAGQQMSRDLLIFDDIRNSSVLFDLLRLLAGQIGNEVSYNELATILGIGRQTVIRYVDILEKSFIIFRLPMYVRNVRGRVGRKFKVYFYDVGIRNALIGQFGTIDLLTRHDVGALWENICILERRKQLSYQGKIPNAFFWKDRTAEVDYIEEINGDVFAYECKWNAERQVSMPLAFNRDIKPKSFSVINQDNLYALVSNL